MKHSKLFLTRREHTRRAAIGVIGLCLLIELMAVIVAAGQTSSLPSSPVPGASATPNATPRKDAPPAKDPVQPGESALVRQRAVMAVMEESLAKQRASILRQVGATGDTGFFILPPPVRMSSIAPAATADCDPLPEAEIGALIDRVAKSEMVQPELVKSVMRQESGFRPCAVSSKGAMGLMQLMPDTANQFHLKDPFDAETNVGAGAKFLKILLDRYKGNLEKALSAYNAGTATVDAVDGIPNIPETIDYVRQILSTIPKAK